MGKLIVGNETLSLDVDKYGIESIIFFGSKYTGLDDRKSDVDLLFIINDVESTSEVTKRIARDLNVPKTWISVYTKKVFYDRAKIGDLFIWCLKIESRVLYSRSGFVENCFNNLVYPDKMSEHLSKSYSHIDKYYTLYKQERIKPEDFMNFIAHHTRDTCIRVCYLHGVINFDKIKPIELCKQYNDIEIPFSIAEYNELLDKKRSYKCDDKGTLFYGNPRKYLDIWYDKLIILFENSIRYAKRIEREDFRDPLRYFTRNKINFNCRYYK